MRHPTSEITPPKAEGKPWNQLRIQTFSQLPIITLYTGSQGVNYQLSNTWYNLSILNKNLNDALQGTRSSENVRKVLVLILIPKRSLHFRTE